MFRLLKLLALGGLVFFVISACTPLLGQALTPMIANLAPATQGDSATAETVADPISDTDKEAYRNLCTLYTSWVSLTGKYRTSTGVILLDAVGDVTTPDPATRAFLKAMRQAVRANGEVAASAAALVHRECNARIR